MQAEFVAYAARSVEVDHDEVEVGPVSIHAGRIAANPTSPTGHTSPAVARVGLGRARASGHTSSNGWQE